MSINTDRSEYVNLLKICKKEGITVKLVPRSKLKDYAAMNDKAAKVLGYPRMKPKSIEIDKTLSSNTKLRTLKHELVERKLMAKGNKYWKSHKIALKKER